MQVQQQAAEFDRVGAQVAVVTYEDARRVQAFAQRERLGFQFLIDEDRLLYQAFHLVQGHGRDLYNVATVMSYLKGLIHLRLPHIPHGDTTQLGGDVVLDAQGRVALVHRSTTPADRPAVTDILRVLRALRDAA